MMPSVEKEQEPEKNEQMTLDVVVKLKDKKKNALPLHRAPTLPLERTLQFSELIDVCSLFFSSRQMAARIVSLRLSVEKLGWIFDRHCIAVYLSNSQDGKPLRAGDAFFRIFLRNGSLTAKTRTVKMSKSAERDSEHDPTAVSCDTISRRDMLPMHLLEGITRHLLHAFRPKTFAVACHHFRFTPSNFVLKYTRKFSSFVQRMDRPCLTPDEMRFVLDGIDVVDSMRFEMYMHRFPYTGHLRPRCLEVWRGGAFVSLQNVLTMRCEQLTLDNSLLTAADLNTIVRRWLDGDIAQTKQLNIERFAMFNDVRAAVIMAGVETTPPDEFRRRAALGAEMHFLIRRRRDGKKACLKIGERGRGGSVGSFLLDTENVEIEPYRPPLFVFEPLDFGF